MRTITLTDEQTHALIRMLRTTCEQQDALCTVSEKDMAVLEAELGLSPEELHALAEENGDNSTLSESHVDWLSEAELFGVSISIIGECEAMIQKLESAPRWDYVDKEPNTLLQRMKVMTFRERVAAMHAWREKRES